MMWLWIVVPALFLGWLCWLSVKRHRHDGPAAPSNRPPTGWPGWAIRAAAPGSGWAGSRVAACENPGEAAGRSWRGPPRLYQQMPKAVL